MLSLAEAREESDRRPVSRMKKSQFLRGGFCLGVLGTRLS